MFTGKTMGIQRNDNSPLLDLHYYYVRDFYHLVFITTEYNNVMPVWYNCYNSGFKILIGNVIIDKISMQRGSKRQNSKLKRSWKSSSQKSDLNVKLMLAVKPLSIDKKLISVIFSESKFVVFSILDFSYTSNVIWRLGFSMVCRPSDKISQ